MFQYFVFTLQLSNELDKVELSLLFLCLKIDFMVLHAGQEGTKVPPKRLLSLKPKSPKKTMHVQEDLENVSAVLNSSYNSVRVITASERIFQETNRAYLSNLSCEQVYDAHSILHMLRTYKLVEITFWT